MRINEINSKKNKLKIAKHFLNWACKQLGIKDVPDVKFDDDKSQVLDKRTFGTTYSNGEIWVYVGERNTADMLRTLCHELVHYKQFSIGTAHNNMTDDEHLQVEDEANAIAGRMMRSYGKINSAIYESRTGSITHEVADSLPQAYVIPALSGKNPYDQYKFSVAIAKARGTEQRQNDRIEKFENQSGDLDNYFRDSEVVVSFDPDIDKIITAALKDIGFETSIKRIGVKGSKESPDVSVRSPINPYKGYKNENK